MTGTITVTDLVDTILPPDENKIKSVEHATAQKNRILNYYLFRGSRYTRVYEICAQS